MKIKVGLLGMGKTGRVVARSFMLDKRFDLVFIVKNRSPRPKDFYLTVEPKEMLPRLMRQFRPNVVVDFTTPAATMRNLRYMQKGMSVVIATTGFTKNQIKSLHSKKHLKILLAPNISDGINILMLAVAKMHDMWPQADVEIIEQHFIGKKDAPSGAAKKIASLFKGKQPAIHAVRVGGIVGIHEVIFATQNQKIVIRHESFGREVFAEGAKRAIIWLNRQKPGFYQMSHLYGKSAAAIIDLKKS